MARYAVHYTEYPNNAEATKYSRESAIRGFYNGGLIVTLTFLALLFYVNDLLALFTVGNVVAYFKSLGILSILMILTICHGIWRFIFVEAKCKMILVEYSKRSPYYPISDAIAAIKKNRWQRAIRAFFISLFLYAVVVGTSVAICGIVSGIKMGSAGKEILLLSIIGLLSLAIISFVIVILWFKYCKEIPRQVISFCKVCNVPLRAGYICPKCAEQILYGEGVTEQKNNAPSCNINFDKKEQNEPTPVSVIEGSTWVCGKCKRRNMSTSKKCWSCGSPLTFE